MFPHSVFGVECSVLDVRFNAACSWTQFLILELPETLLKLLDRVLTA